MKGHNFSGTSRVSPGRARLMMLKLGCPLTCTAAKKNNGAPDRLTQVKEIQPINYRISDMRKVHAPKSEQTRQDGPPCTKCKQPTRWHSVQTVKARDGSEEMQIFECEKCGRLTVTKSTNQ